MPPAPAGRSPAATRQHLLDVLGPVVARIGCDLEDVAVQAAGRRSLVRVIVDADGGVDLDRVAEVSRVVSDVLDADGDAFAGPFVLEVSSPGVDRPLREARHWRRAVGRRVQVPISGVPFTGRVLAADGSGVRFATDGAERLVPWSELGDGRVQIEFSHAGSAEETDDEDTEDDGDIEDDDFEDDGDEPIAGVEEA